MYRNIKKAAITDGGPSLTASKKKNRKGKKDLKLLSFGEDALELEGEEEHSFENGTQFRIAMQLYNILIIVASMSYFNIHHAAKPLLTLCF